MKFTKRWPLVLLFLVTAASMIVRLQAKRSTFSPFDVASVPRPVQKSEKGIEAEEYAVYATLINKIGREEKNSDRLLVIEEQPTPWISGIDDGNFYEEMKKGSPALMAETVDDLRAKNKESFKLARNFDIGRQYVILSDEEVKAIFKAGVNEGWKAFHEKYPQAGGIVMFSRVGFNADKTQALVYRGYKCGGLCGGGEYYLLNKKNGVWVVAGNVGPSWVS